MFSKSSYVTDILQRASTDPSLKFLNLGFCGLTDSDLDEIMAVVVNKKNIIGINLSKKSRYMPFARSLEGFGVREGIENQLTSVGMAKLARLKYVQFLSLDGNAIGDAGVLALSKMPHLEKLWVINCNITPVGARYLLDFSRLEFLHDAYNYSLDKALDEAITKHLKNNQLRSGMLTEQDLLKDQAVDAAISGQTDKLRAILPQLPNGANTVEGEDHLLLCAAQFGHEETVQYLLACGAQVETHDRREQKTPLFVAAESGHDRVVFLLLWHAANMTGEFDFNQEDAVSIIIFKFRELFDSALKKVKQDILSTKLKDKIARLLALNAAFSPGTETLIIRTNDKVQVVEQEQPPWIALGEHPHKHEVLILMAEIGSFLKDLDYFERESQHEEFRQWQEIAESLARKLCILKGRPFEIPGETNPLDSPTSFQLTVPVSDSKKLPRLTKEEVFKVLEEINTTIRDVGIDAVEWDKYPRFFIVQHRGIHFYTHLFSKEQRADFANTCHLNRDMTCSGAFEMSGSSVPEKQLTRESSLQTAAVQLKGAARELAQTGPIRGHWPGTRLFPSGRALFQQRYSNSMPGFRGDLITPGNLIHKVFNPLGVTKTVPVLSTADLPTHALRYAFGLKPDGTSKGKELNPHFSESFIPQEPCVGVFFTNLVSIVEWEKSDPNQVIAMQAAGVVDVSFRILYETETSFFGKLSQETNWLQTLIAVPSFDSYREEYLSQYNLDLRTFNLCKKWLAEDAVTGLTKVLHKLAECQSQRIQDLSQQEASRRGGYIVYRNEHGFYQLDPPTISDISAARKASSSSGRKRPSPSNEPSSAPLIIPQFKSKKSKSSSSDIEEQIAIWRSLQNEDTHNKSRKYELFHLIPYDVPFEVGDCLFEAIQLQEPRFKSATEARAMAINQLKTDPELQQMLSVISHDSADNLKLCDNRLVGFSNPNEYIHHMSQNRTWGTYLEIVALSRALGRPMVIFSPSFESPHIVELSNYQQNTPIFLERIGEHYRPMEIPRESSANEILRAIRNCDLDANRQSKKIATKIV